MPTHSPPQFAEQAFDLIHTDVIPQKHQYGVLQLNAKTAREPKPLAQPPFRPGGIAAATAVRSQSASPSGCSAAGRHSQCSRTIRSRSPGERADELGLQIFEFLRKGSAQSKKTLKAEEGPGKASLPLADRQTASFDVVRQPKAILPKAKQALQLQL